MKIIDVEVNDMAGNCYTCLKAFSNQDIEKFYIILNIVEKFCSYKCYFRFAYSILSRYPNSELKQMWLILFEHIPTPNKRHEVIFELTKYFTKHNGN